MGKLESGQRKGLRRYIEYYFKQQGFRNHSLGEVQVVCGVGIRETTRKNGGDAQLEDSCKWPYSMGCHLIGL